MSERPVQDETDVTDYIRSIDVAAPRALHERVDALVAERSAGRSGLRSGRRGAMGGSARAWGLAGVGMLALVVLALVLVTGGGTASAPTTQSAASLALRPATLPAPAQSRGQPRQLAAAVDGVAFPYWEDRYGWRATGARIDHVAGREITTVFYANARGQRIGYAIVGGSPAPALDAGNSTWRDGSDYHLLTIRGHPAVAWLRAGHLCVIAGQADHRTLLELASWDSRRQAA